jgi:hypothetical protein
MRSHKRSVVSLFEALAYVVKETDPDGLDLYFTDPTVPGPVHSKDTKRLVRAVETRWFDKDVDLTGKLTKILGDYEKRLQGRKGLFSFLKFWGPRLRPMTVYVFTDGVGCSKSRTEIEDLMVTMEDALSKAKVDESHLGIQIIQFGGGVQESRELQQLCSVMKRYSASHFLPTLKMMSMLTPIRTIIDVEPFDDGNVWKMLLGSSVHWNSWRLPD